MDKRHWLAPAPTTKATPTQLDYDPAYVDEIMQYYHDSKTVPNMLPDDYKHYLLSVGLAEYLTPDYIVFSAAGGELARQANRNNHHYNPRGGRPRKTA